MKISSEISAARVGPENGSPPSELSPDIAQDVPEAVVNVGVGPGYVVDLACGLGDVVGPLKSPKIRRRLCPTRNELFSARNRLETGLPYLQMLSTLYPEVLVTLPAYFLSVLAS